MTMIPWQRKCARTSFTLVQFSPSLFFSGTLLFHNQQDYCSEGGIISFNHKDQKKPLLVIVSTSQRSSHKTLWGSNHNHLPVYGRLRDPGSCAILMRNTFHECPISNALSFFGGGPCCCNKFWISSLKALDTSERLFRYCSLSIFGRVLLTDE